MSVLVNKDTRLLCQGITGSAGGFHSAHMLNYGTNLVAGCTPGKGGQTFTHEKAPGKSAPIYNTVAEAVAQQGRASCPCS